MQEEAHFLNVLYRSMDIEDHDKETLHLVIFLLMQVISFIFCKKKIIDHSLIAFLYPLKSYKIMLYFVHI